MSLFPPDIQCLLKKPAGYQIPDVCHDHRLMHVQENGHNHCNWLLNRSLFCQDCLLAFIYCHDDLFARPLSFYRGLSELLCFLKPSLDSGLLLLWLS